MNFSRVPCHGQNSLTFPAVHWARGHLDRTNSMSVIMRSLPNEAYSTNLRSYTLDSDDCVGHPKSSDHSRSDRYLRPFSRHEVQQKRRRQHLSLGRRMTGSQFDLDTCSLTLPTITLTGAPQLSA
jgi:hypothetical protein